MQQPHFLIIQPPSEMSFDEIIWYDNTMLTTILVPDLKPRAYLVDCNPRQLYISLMIIKQITITTPSKKCSHANKILNNKGLAVAL